MSTHVIEPGFSKEDPFAQIWITLFPMGGGKNAPPPCRPPRRHQILY